MIPRCCYIVDDTFPLMLYALLLLLLHLLHTLLLLLLPHFGCAHISRTRFAPRAHHCAPHRCLPHAPARAALRLPLRRRARNTRCAFWQRATPARTATRLRRARTPRCAAPTARRAIFAAAPLPPFRTFTLLVLVTWPVLLLRDIISTDTFRRRAADVLARCLPLLVTTGAIFTTRHCGCVALAFAAGDATYASRGRLRSAARFLRHALSLLYLQNGTIPACGTAASRPHCMPARRRMYCRCATYRLLRLCYRTALAQPALRDITRRGVYAGRFPYPSACTN